MSSARTVTPAVALALVVLGGCLAPVEQGTEAVPEAAPEAVTAQVTRVIDGDTLEVEVDGARERVRLVGIDAPEVGRDGLADECGAVQASEALKDMLKHGQVDLVADVGGTEDRDRFGRLLRHVHVEDLDIGQWLVERGWAIAWAPRSAARPARMDLYEAAEQMARDEGVGMWALCEEERT
ncbi:MAG: thermonuclease family protein [Micrococcus sp.]|nr:thermonuclease family protein [Micrococcus sp.]